MLSPSAQKVQDALNSGGFECQVIELADSTRTALDAAQAVNCEVGQIVKSLIFRTKQSHKPVLVVASGANRVNEKKIAALVGEPIERATPEFVREQTGYAIGGVPPLAHANSKIQTYIDEDLLAFEDIWAAAGTPHALFKLTPKALTEMTAGGVVNITA
jgi:prolyl-tRNA editing enzyme YbaK/EbsC (Cys-tRNA(Pro) deacylase)